MTTREECIQGAAKCLVEAEILFWTLPVEEAARRAFTPSGPPVEEIAARIRAAREQQRRRAS